MSNNQRFEQISKTNKENIRRLISKDDQQRTNTTNDNEQLIDEVISKTKSLFNADDLGRTSQYLIDSLSTDGNICLICIDAIQQTDAIWNCSCCYSPFHIVCIQTWIKDGIYQLPESNTWHCPKCRNEFERHDTPKRYYCYCQKELDPKFDPWLIPHSCGQTCGKRLIPECGHICLLLCHPGPCPPCPKQVNVKCYCNQTSPTARRCGFKGWSCGKKCSKFLSCQQHRCEQVCHAGECLSCQKTSIRSCQCGKTKAIRNCNELNFQCDQPCGRLLNCEIHKCKRICHKDECGPCPRQGLRTCPCGKTKYENLSCSEDVSTCGDTCDRKLNCGLHRCLLRCHTGDCEPCQQVVVKRCRCDLKEKSLPCSQEFLCESKCSRLRACGKHPCKRKCCDGNCSPCQIICNKTLNCRNHKCLSECHRGTCYPCTQKIDVTCACRHTSITVPCGCEKQTRKPRCNQLCRKLPNCHHEKRHEHLCHFGDCLPCKQICDLPLKTCLHTCSSICHDVVLIKENIHASNTPWGLKEKEKFVEKSLPCPPCQVPITVSCFGQHTSKTLACSLAKEFCCGQQCNRLLKCENHLCNRACHLITDSNNECIQCEEMCSKMRPNGCQHSCPLTCHSGSCPPCQQRLRMRCHCNSQMIFTDCQTFINANDEQKETMKSCGKQCSKKLTCEHSCTYSCHSGACLPINDCMQLVQVRCLCRRIQKQLPCSNINTVKNFRLTCDETCAEIKKQRIAAAAAAKPEAVVEENKSAIEVETPVIKRKIRKDNSSNTPISVKKSRPRRFIWTFNRVLIVFSLFTLVTVSLIIYMFKQIA